MGSPYATSSGQMYGNRLRNRGSVQYAPARHSISGPSGVLPTPDPTVGSAISDEDVALQLMRLGDASNFPSRGRTSTSTLDDAFSGKAEAASSAGESEEDHSSLLPAYPYGPAGYAQHNNEEVYSSEAAETSGDDYDDNKDESFFGSDEIVPEGLDQAQAQGMMGNGVNAGKHRHSVPKVSSKHGKHRSLTSSLKTKTKVSNGMKAPMSPASMPPQSRKASIASTIPGQHPLGSDEVDLSAKPRCQRCRKSKKGCDRQRPCGRCKDAGIGIEGCISEDEGNGRKGRYGRHMGVPVKKDMLEGSQTFDAPPPLAPMPTHRVEPATLASGNQKKRKR